MGLVKFFKGQDINEGLKKYQETEGAFLIDVREADEFQSGHIPGAVNQPLSAINNIRIAKDKPLYVYCLHGSRSKKAVGILNFLTFSNNLAVPSLNGFGFFCLSFLNTISIILKIIVF